MKKEKRKMKKIIISFCIFLILLVILACIYIFFIEGSSYINRTITASKKVTGIEQAEKIIYKINVIDYNIVSVKKEMKFKTKEDAEAEKDIYETINEFEKRDIKIELKNKTLKLELPVNYFEDEIDYNAINNVTIQTQNGEQKEIIDIQKIVELLTEQGYTIK